MKINRLKFKNIKSYGNILQTLDFSDNGELILLSGKNGSGKSTIRDVIDLALFGKVPGKRKKTTPLNKLPNRINKNLFVGIDFNNNNGDNINIERYIEPTKLSVSINNIDKTDIFKKFTDEQKDNLIGYNFDTFKSFISLSMNDFKNFITLSDSEKKILLNKLFNLEKIDILHSITKDTLKQFELSLQFKYDKFNNNKSILESTQKILNSLKNNNSVDKDEIKKILQSKKPLFEQLKKDIEDKNDSLLNLEKEYKKYLPQQWEKEKYINKLKINLEDIYKKLEIYDGGNCPFCESILIESFDKKNELVIKKDEIELLIKNESEILDSMKMEIAKYTNKIESLKKEIFQLNINFTNLTNELKKLKADLNKEESTLNKDEIENEYIRLREETIQLQKELKELKSKKEIYLKLVDILSDSSQTRKNIIKKSILPINKYLKEFTDKTKSDFSIKLDENFDAKINERVEIDPELLSTGEDRKINIIIALSYLCSILDNNKSNILFIDELFNSIDKDNINLILKLLKEISLKYKINIIVVHHYIDLIEREYFDKIIQVNKNIFSDIQVIKK